MKGNDRSPAMMHVRLANWRLAWQRQWQRHYTRRRLRDLDARLLDDVGISAARAEHEARKPFWRR
ncbi:DUF1127 domain-containing protein [Halomonas elongata]|nr:DUF1127 domain-containing protein [Halomonas elongata]